MSEQATADAMSDNANEETTETTDAAETAATDEWESKYQGQLKVNRDLEEKLKNATGLARKKLEAEFERKLQETLALKDKPAEEQALEAARAEARAEATKAANARILRSELKALATGKLADPADAHLYINLDDFTVDDNGDVDSDALNDAISDLLTRKPHLAAVKPTRFDGDADQGAKGKESGPSQLTQADLDRMVAAKDHDGIAKARAEGRFNKILGIS